MLTCSVRLPSGRRVRPEVRRELERRLERAMRAAGVGDSEVSLSLVDDREILRLNRDYAGEDHATDVLSFSQLEGRTPPAHHLLGDIIISVDTAARQARAAGRSLIDELAHLAVHGLAHLLGYDHATSDEERVMFGYETRLRAQAEARGDIKRVRRPAQRD
jgi:probable rRNA maturation factor